MKSVNVKRLGVDIPTDLKTKVAIKALRDGLSLTDVVIRLLCAWLDGSIKLTR